MCCLGTRENCLNYATQSFNIHHWAGEMHPGLYAHSFVIEFFAVQRSPQRLQTSQMKRSDSHRNLDLFVPHPKSFFSSTIQTLSRKKFSNTTTIRHTHAQSVIKGLLSAAD